MPFFQIYLLSAAVILLLIALLIQISQLKTLRKRLSRRVPITSTKDDTFALLADFPEALLIINHSGQILFRTSRFTALPAPYGSIKHLKELDEMLGTHLLERLRNREGEAKFELTFRVAKASHNDLERLPYLAFSWPVHSPDVVLGRAIAFFPQTTTKTRQLEYPRLEQQLLHYLLTSSQEMATMSKEGNLPAIAQHSQQMHELAEYIQILHTPLRAQKAVTQVHVKPIIDSAIKTFRQDLRQNQVQSISTITSSLSVLGNKDDLYMLFGLLLHLSCANATPGSLRIDAKQDRKRVILEIEHPYRESEADMFQKMQTALAKQLAAKLAATLEISVSSGDLRHYTLSLPAK